MWVPRTPKRADFCGCPPCPICFDWAGGDELMDGMKKFTQDMLDGNAPTKTEEQVLKDAAEKIHVANLSRDERIAEEIRAADKAQHTQRQMDAMLAARRADAARPKPLNTVTLDGMDLSYVEEEERRKKEPKKTDLSWGNVGIGIPSFMVDFERAFQKQIEADMTRMFYGTAPSFFGMDLAKAAASSSIGEPMPITDKERRRIQAEEDAKKRMKLQAREPVRR